MTAILQTADFGLGLLTPILLCGIVVMFVTSPLIVVGWAFGFGREIFADNSDEARLAIAVHLVTTALVIFIAVVVVRGIS